MVRLATMERAVERTRLNSMYLNNKTTIYNFPRSEIKAEIAAFSFQKNNPDYFKTGLNYLQVEPIEENETCPFCQERTISNTLVASIKNYYDESYEKDIKTLKGFLEGYSQAIQSIPSKSTYEVNPKFKLQFREINQPLSAICVFKSAPM